MLKALIYLKSSMDRFIEIMSEKKQLRYLYLKSSMDRFIVDKAVSDVPIVEI